MAGRNKKDRYARVCPKCGSMRINIFYRSKAHSIGIFPTEYKCSDCGYTGKFFMEVPEGELKKYRKKRKGNNETDNKLNSECNGI